MARGRKALIAGNWKMNGLLDDGVDRARGLLALVAAADRLSADIVLCPPATLLAILARELRGSPVALGGQDCHADDRGAHTGDVAAPMLADCGCRFVIVGHSERRADHGEKNALVRRKAEAAHRAGLVAIVCLGENQAERAKGRALAVVEKQLKGSLPKSADAANTVIAYEPVWAIGSGETATGEDIAAVHGHLRGLLDKRLGAAGAKVRILYGGSVKPANVAEILAIDNVNGALVGGASLVVDDFWAICRAAP